MELLEDIMHALTVNGESEYFLGSMVLRKEVIKEEQTTYDEYHILDGQQRLTTLFILNAVIRDLADDPTLLDISEKAVFQKENTYYNIPERLRIVFDIRTQVRDFVDEYLKTKDGTKRIEELRKKANDRDEDISIRNMSNTILTISDYFQTKDYKKFFSYLSSNVLMIYVATEELEDAFRLFTILNSRGVKLRNSDILKANNLGLIKDEKTRKEWAEKWEEIENYYGEDFDTFLSHLRTILVKQKASASLLKEFEDNIHHRKEFDRNTKEYKQLPPLLEKGLDTLRFIAKFHTHYQSLFEKDNYDLHKNYQLYNFLYLMRKGFEADYWMAPLLRFYDKFKEEKLLEFVMALDNKFASDWMLGYTPTTRIENVNAITQAIDDATLVDEVLISSTLQFDANELLRVLNSNIYGKRAAKYVLLKIDLLYHGHTTKFELPERISIEHILPQNPPVSSQWQSDFTIPERLEWTHKIGNLVLISRNKNSAQSNKDYSIKKEKYFKSNIELFSNSVRIYQQYITWVPSDLQDNHAKVISKLKSAFGI